ncbi:DNA-binding response regulator [Alteromonas sp. I4]|nr:DNA-binding response regulator [Alteromonas sp. I4]
MIKLLLVEDDLDLAGNVMDYLELEDIVCDHASNGVAALQLLADNRYQVVVLDINLPRLDGLQVCARAREQGNDTPIIMLTARDQLQDKITGFEQGADDYLVKPFAMEELVMRVKALAKRRSAQNKQLAVSGLVMDLSGKSVRYNGAVLHCSPTGFKLLEQLMRANPNPIDRDELVELVWGEESPDSNSLKVHMHKLRKVLSSASVPMEINFKTQVGFSLSPVQES